MRGRAFNSLLSGRRLGTLLKWQHVHRCPCALEDGVADTRCAVCHGRGRYYDAWSTEFRAGFLGQNSKTLMSFAKAMGGNVDIGDAALVIPSNAPCYRDIATYDRVQLMNASDTIEWTLVPGSAVKLPPEAVMVSATAKSVDGSHVVPVALPTVGTDGRVSVAVSTVLQLRVARIYEVSMELARVREFDTGDQPKFVPLHRIDWTTR